jgi:predicted tellurium resistance membrane protein TerC
MYSMRRLWLAVIVLLCLVPSTLIAKPKHRKHYAMPEGGSGLVYVLGAGVTCAGAMFLRAREKKANHA